MRALNVFYGNGKLFYRQRVAGLGHASSRFWLSVVDPRARLLMHSHLRAKAGDVEFLCEKRRTQLQELEGAAKDRLLRKATFRGLYWRRQPHLLARDDDGRYFYVDRTRFERRALTPDLRGVDYKGFRLWSGQRGKMARLKLKNVVADPAGQIFITPAGKLFVKGQWGKRAVFWLPRKGKRKLPLTYVPISRHNGGLVMVYQQLGPYVGVELKKPCDQW